MKKLIGITILTLALLSGCSIEEKRAEGAIKAYYEALMNDDYKTAFEKLYLYDEDFFSPTTLTTAEAKDVFLEKTAILMEQGYHLKNYAITEVEYEDGHSFWHHLTVE